MQSVLADREVVDENTREVFSSGLRKGLGRSLMSVLGSDRIFDRGCNDGETTTLLAIFTSYLGAHYNMNPRKIHGFQPTLLRSLMPEALDPHKYQNSRYSSHLCRNSGPSDPPRRSSSTLLACRSCQLRRTALNSSLCTIELGFYRLMRGIR